MSHEDKADPEEEEKKAKADRERVYYQLNLHVNELREPRYSQEPISPAKPCENYNRFYLPNGQQVALKSQKQQSQERKKLYIDDWKREQKGYDCVFEGEKYHMV